MPLIDITYKEHTSILNDIYDLAQNNQTVLKIFLKYTVKYINIINI
jgi:hypothetical protein